MYYRQIEGELPTLKKKIIIKKYSIWIYNEIQNNYLKSILKLVGGNCMPGLVVIRDLLYYAFSYLFKATGLSS